MREAFAHHGAAVLRGVLDAPAVAALRDEAERLWAEQTRLEPQNLRLGLRRDRAGAWVLDRLDPVADLSRRFDELNRDPRLLGPVREVLGEAPAVLKEKLVYKRPGTHGFGPHRDGHYFGAAGAAAEEVVTVMLALDAADATNGAVILYPALRQAELASPADEPRDIAPEALPHALAVQPALNAGDLLLFDGCVPHCSEPNRSRRPRRAYFVTYAPARLPRLRARYYEQRLREQEAERAAHHDGPFYFA